MQSPRLRPSKFFEFITSAYIILCNIVIFLAFTSRFFNAGSEKGSNNKDYTDIDKNVSVYCISTRLYRAPTIETVNKAITNESSNTLQQYFSK
jgi:hypothetical protein